MKDYYSILGVEKNADEKEIKKAYRTLSKKHHPDISKENGAEDKFKEVSEAYEVLGDKNKRAQYDRGGSNHGGFGGFEDIFSGGASTEDFFSSFFGGDRNSGRAQNNSKGKDVKIRLGITLDQVEIGDQKNIKYKRNIKCVTCNGVGGAKKDTCSICNGSGRRVERIRTQLGYIQNESICHNCGGRGHIVIDKCNTCNGKAYIQKEENLTIKIPNGVSQGMVFKYTEKGNEGEKISGDLLIEFVINEHKHFKRQNLNLIYELKVPFNLLICGASVEIPGLNNKKYSINIPKMSQPGYNLRLKGRGLPKINTVDVKGDMIVILEFEYPTGITDEELEIVSNLNNKPNFTYKNKNV